MLLDTAAFFSRTLIPTNVSNGPSRRVPFMFTSTKRLLSNGGVAGVSTSRELAKKQAKDTLKSELNTIEGISVINSVIGMIGTLGWSSFSSALPVSPVISMMVNPNMIRWSQPKRYTKRDTMNGSVFFHFSDENGRNNDILTMQFSGNTGNISTQDAFDFADVNKMGINSVTATGADLKLRTWHELYNLTREEVLLSGGAKNEFFITYRTVLMPIPITMVGFFNSVMEFSENAEKPFSRDYSFAFTVTDTSPRLDVLVDKINSALLLPNAVSAIRSV